MDVCKFYLLVTLINKIVLNIQGQMEFANQMLQQINVEVEFVKMDCLQMIFNVVITNKVVYQMELIV